MVTGWDSYCTELFYLVMGSTSVGSITLFDAQFAYPRRMRIANTLQSFSCTRNFSCIGFGFTFMGTTSLVMLLAKRLHAPFGINLLGLAILTYGFGQILGPLLASFLQFGSHTITFSVICSAVALFAAAGICQYCLCRKG